MEKRKLFKFYSSYYDVANELDDKNRLAFYDAIMKRQFTGVETELQGMAKFAFISQKHSIDKQIEGWEFKMKTNLTTEETEPNKGGSVGGVEGGGTQEEVEEKVKEEEKVEEVYKGYLFSEIKNFREFYNSFKFNKQYFHIAYKFWQIWNKENPQHKTLMQAKISNWYDAIRLIVEVDKQKIDRLIAILKYFEKCQAKDLGYSSFWFKNLKSVGALRDTNKNGEYRLDKIADEINDMVNKDSAFERLIGKAIIDFKKY